jgi:hypothetical protein
MREIVDKHFADNWVRATAPSFSSPPPESRCLAGGSVLHGLHGRSQHVRPSNPSFPTVFPF